MSTRTCLVNLFLAVTGGAGIDPLVVFDMDGVLVFPRSSWRVVHDHFGVDNEESFFLYMKGEIDDLEFMRRDISLWRSVAGTLTVSMIEEVFTRVRRMKGLDAAVRMLRGKGLKIAIVSGGIDLLAKSLSPEASFDHILANGLETDSGGTLTGEGILRVPLRDKGSSLRELIEKWDLEPVVAVGDSAVDGSMFSMSDLSIGFRPMENSVESMVDEVVDGEDLMKVAKRVIRWME